MSDAADARAELQRAAVQRAVDAVYRTGAVSGSCALGYDPDTASWWAEALVVRPGSVLEEVTNTANANAVEALEALAEQVASAVSTEPEHLPPAGLR